MINELHNNINIWNIFSIIQNNVIRLNSVSFFEYEGEVENSKLLNTWKFNKYNMGLDFLSHIMLAVYGHIERFDVKINIYGSDVVVNLKLLNRKDDTNGNGI